MQNKSKPFELKTIKNDIQNFFLNLFRKKFLSEPTYSGIYYQAYLSAHRRTKSWRLDVQPLHTSKDEYLSSIADVEKVVKFISDFYLANDIAMVDAVARCWHINMLIKQPLEEYFGVPLELTMGSIETYPGTVRYDMKEHEALQLLSQPIGFNGNMSVNLHAWLTLPSMEILDVTFLTSYGVANNMPEIYGGIVYGPPEKLSQPTYIYRPLVLGSDFVQRSGMNAAMLIMG